MSQLRRLSPALIAALALLVAACGSKKDKTKSKDDSATSKKSHSEESASRDDGSSGNDRLASMTVLRKSLARVNKSYADLDRIDPQAMLYEALHLVQFRIPEVLVEADRKKGKVAVSVNEKHHVFDVRNVSSPRTMVNKLREVFRFIETNMNPGADIAQVEYAAINGMLSTLDPHSVLLDPETAREMDVHTRGKFGGLGIIIRMYKEHLTVVRPLSGTPAKRAGIKTGDRIIKIDDEVTENLTLTEAVSRMRGDPGTSVTLWVDRKGVSGLEPYRIKRAVIRVESVEHRKLEGNVGYIRIKQFSGRTAKEVKTALADLKAKGADRFILDLRWNPGGLLERSIEVADQFLDKGDIVTTIGGGQREQRDAKPGGDTTSPLVVLVNGSSASASEIVSGALRYQNRALLIGTRTFGKGSVQVLYDNKDGSKLKLTVAEYLTAGGRSIQSVGITPDIALQYMFVPKHLKGPDDQIRLLPPTHRNSERDLKAHLVSRYAKKAEPPANKLRYLYQPPERQNDLRENDADSPSDDEPLDDKFREDFPITLARQVLQKATKATRKAMLKQVAAMIPVRQRAEDEKTGAALKKLGIDWRAAPKGAQPTQRITATVRASSARINAGDTVKLIGTVTNKGKQPAYRVHMRIKADDYSFDERELVFGYIAPGQSRTFTMPVELSQAAVDRVDVLQFEFREQLGAKAEVAPLKLRIVDTPGPVFAYSYQLIDDGNGDGLVQPGEHVRVRVTVKNTGSGAAGRSIALMRNASGDDVLLRKARFDLGEIEPGETKTAEFAMDVARAPRLKQLLVEMSVTDRKNRAGLREKLKFDYKPAADIQAASGTLAVSKKTTAIHEGAGTHTSTVAYAKHGATFKKTGVIGDWIRVDLGGGRPGFIAKADVTDAVGATAKPAITPHWQVTPPKLKLNVPTLETDRATYTLQGRITDETRVEDVYIYVSNRGAKIEDKKVFYKSNRANKKGPSARQLSFAQDIPLWPGSNLITVVARENRDVMTLRRLVIYKK